MFRVSASAAGAVARVGAMRMLHATDEKIIAGELQQFIQQQVPQGQHIDLFISGEDGDNRFHKYCAACENVLNKQTGIARFKHMMGEYATASAAALWLACHILESQHLPAHMVKQPGTNEGYQRILMYNAYKLRQHSFILVEKVVGTAGHTAFSVKR